jgi:hypothetical protein
MIGITQDVRVVEISLSQEALRIECKPPACAKLENIAVVHVTMQHADLTWICQ